MKAMKIWGAAALVLLLACPFAAGAAEEAKPLKRAAHEEWFVDKNWAGFLSRHPDMWNYAAGANAYNRGDHAKAMMHFRKAARYADKPSQAMLAEMLWNGRGVRADRAEAYAWADLAAERGYPELEALREGMWAGLSPSERERALQIGAGLYAEFGDEVAQPRVLTALRWARKELVGSRTGRSTNATIYAPPPGDFDACAGSAVECGQNVVGVPASQFFASIYWEPQQYFKWRELHWREQVRDGGTMYGEVGELESVRPGTKDRKPGSK